MKIRKKEIPYIELLGLAILDLSILLAFKYQYKHFYEFLVVGMFLILYGLDYKYIILPSYLRMYVRFVKAGIVIDLVMGLTITKFWHYNYSSFFDYIPLYFIVYPVAGMVMVQSYIFLNRRFVGGRSDRIRISPFIYKTASLCLAAALIYLIRLIVDQKANPLIMAAFFTTVYVNSFLALCYISSREKRRSVLGDLHSSPFRMLLILITVTYFNAFLHEIPNTVAHEWVYTNYLWNDRVILGIPLFVLIGWPILSLLPASVYYVLVDRAPRRVT